MAKDLAGQATTAAGTAARLSPATINADRGPTVPVPALGSHITLPSPDRLAFYAGVATLAAIEIIDWPVALVVAAGHAIATRSRNQAMKGLAEGIESDV